MSRCLNKFFLFWIAPIVSMKAAEKVTYDDHVFPIFEQSCLNCHNPDKTKGGLDLSSFTAVMKGGSGGKIAEAGDVSSKILTSILRTADPKMPPEGDALSPAQIAVVKAWIDGGLLENKNSAARKPSKPKFDASMSANPATKPEGPPPMPADVLLEPVVVTARGASIRAIAASPWAPLLAISSQKQVLLLNSDSLELVGVLPFPEGDPVSIAFTPDARYLIVGGGIPGKSGTTITFDVKSAERILAVGKEFDSILAADIRPGFDIVATGSPSRLVKLWNTQTGESIKSIKKHTDWITSLDISPDGILLATGDRNGGVYVWETESGNEFHTLRAHQAGIQQVQFRNDSNLLATASADGTVRFWEMNGGSEVKKIDAHAGGVTSFSWTRNGSFVTTGRDLKAKLWKADFNLAKEFPALPALPTAICIDAEGKRCFVGNVNGNISVFDCAGGQLIATLANNPPTIAARLVEIDKTIAAHPASLVAAQKSATEAQGKVEEQKKISAAQNADLEQKKAALVQAQKGESDIKGKLDAVRQQLTAKRAEADAMRPLQQQALAALEPAKAALTVAQQAGDGAPIETAQNALKEVENKSADLSNKLAAIDANVAVLAKQEQEGVAALAAATQSLAAVQAAIAPAEAALKTANDALASIAKSATDLQTAFTQQQNAALPLKQSRNHWTAAAINTRALAEKNQSVLMHREFEDQVAQFQSSCLDYEKLSAALQKAGIESNALQTNYDEYRSKEPIDAAKLKECEALIAKNVHEISEIFAALQKSAVEIGELRQQLDQKSAARIVQQSQSLRLKAEYVKQRDKKIE
jgi:Planctomycete cytochrome C/WD domain, G-beta repeat